MDFRKNLRVSHHWSCTLKMKSSTWQLQRISLYIYTFIYIYLSEFDMKRIQSWTYVRQTSWYISDVAVDTVLRAWLHLTPLKNGEMSAVEKQKGEKFHELFQRNWHRSRTGNLPFTWLWSAQINAQSVCCNNWKWQHNTNGPIPCCSGRLIPRVAPHTPIHLPPLTQTGWPSSRTNNGKPVSFIWSL